MAIALRRWAPIAIIAAAAVAVAWGFAVTTLRHTRPMGLPLDDSYIYLTYAKQFGRAQPFTYYPGGGYSAGSTSVLWPMLLAPFWTLGARGHALVWVSFLLCTALYATTALGVWRVVRRFAGDVVATVAALLLLAIAPFAWTSLSGMEVAFAGTLIVAMILLLLEQPPTGPPSRLLAVVLAATSLSRPEATLLVAGVIAVAVYQRRRDPRAAAWWCVPLAAPVAWLVANKLLAGNFFPNTGVVKSHFYLPGFDWTYWLDTVSTQTGRMLKGLFWDGASPLVWPKLFAVAWLVGAVRIVRWARREQRRLAGALLVAGPLVMVLAVIATSGQWSFQNYRYIAPAFPLLVLGIGFALAPPPRVPRRYWCAGAAALFAVFAWFALPPLAADARLFAQGAMDTNTQVVAIGEYVHERLPGASLMLHDAGAIAYYGDGRVYDMLGLVTNHQAAVANNGPGARFELLESMRREQRPTHFAYYPGWMGNDEFFGEVLMHTSLRPGFEPRRFVGAADMQVIAARFDHLGTGELPFDEHPGWRVVDRIDIADIASERAHNWRGDVGRRTLEDRTAKWSFVGRDTGPHGLVLDGGRAVRGGRETFDAALDPAKPVRLVLRTGGLPSYPFEGGRAGTVQLRVRDASDRELASVAVPAPAGAFVEIPIALPAGVRPPLRTAATGSYHAFHWFVLQPE